MRLQQERQAKDKMRVGLLGRMMVVSSLLALVLGAIALGQDRERFAQETGLDVDLVSVVKVDVSGSELTIVFVFVNERTFNSRISADLRAALLPYLGQNAIYVNPNIKDVVSHFAFDPNGISTRSSDGSSFQPGLKDWIEITPGFLEGRFEMNPAGASQGSGSEGILLLRDAIDSAAPFDVYYGSERASFSISAHAPASGGFSTGVGGPAAATQSHDPIAVPLIDDVATLEELLALPGFTAESMAALFELPLADVQAVETEAPSREILRLLYVRLEESVRDSALGEEMIEQLDPLIGTGAVMVWAFSPTGSLFSPWNFFIQQAETNFVFFSSASFVELTSGFVRTERLAAGELVAGVIRLPRGADPLLPFSVFYGSARADFL